MENVERLRITCDLLGVNEGIFRFLSKPQRTVITNFPVKMDSGSIEMFEGYRVLHSNVLGPAKGGVQFTPTCSVAEMQALAMIMTLKTSLIGLPMGGSKGGVKVDPKRLSKRELELLTRQYTRSIFNVIGPDQDVPGPDLNVNEQVMAWMMDQYSIGLGKTTPGVVTGKPVEIGGTLGREQAVGWGLATILKEYTEKESEEIRDQKIVIQGIGHVGRNVALTASRYGAKIIGISDSTTGLYDEDGININDVLQWKQENGSLRDYPRANPISNDEMLTLKCDALLPCATTSVITKDNADKIQCRVIIEGANQPTTLEADRIVDEKGISLIPDIIANAGGVIASYFEWIQDLSSLHWDIDRVNRELGKIILVAFEKIVQMRRENAVSYRQAAHMVAVKRVAKAIQYRGFYP